MKDIEFESDKNATLKKEAYEHATNHFKSLREKATKSREQEKIEIDRKYDTFLREAKSYEQESISRIDQAELLETKSISDALKESSCLFSSWNSTAKEAEEKIKKLQELNDLLIDLKNQISEFNLDEYMPCHNYINRTENKSCQTMLRLTSSVRKCVEDADINNNYPNSSFRPDLNSCHLENLDIFDNLGQVTSNEETCESNEETNEPNQRKFKIILKNNVIFEF